MLAAALGRGAFRNSALWIKHLLLRASLSESTAASFKSFIYLEDFQKVSYVPLSSSSPPPSLNLTRQIHIINISVPAVCRHWLLGSALNQ